MFNGMDIEKIVKLRKKEADILTIYDKYEVTCRLKSGEEKNITLYADKGTVPESIPEEYNNKKDEYNKKRGEFFLGMLFQENQSEYIYIGSFNYKNNGKPVNDIYSATKDGLQSKYNLFNTLMEALELYKNGKMTYKEILESFPELIEIQKILESNIENQKPEERREDKAKDFRSSLNPNNYDQKTKLPTKGKHYALGDIHGYKEPYNIALRQIKREDSLVLIGDVVDRGPDGVEILQDLIKRKANTPESNITFILGNHEIMMFEALNYILKLNLSNETIGNINDYFNYNARQERIYKLYREEGHGDIELAETLSKQCEIIKEKIKKTMSNDNINIDKMIETIGIWCNYKNGGIKTLQTFMKLNIDEQKDIFNFLRTSYVMKQQEVQGRKILFVHSRPPKDINIVKNLSQNNNYGVRANDLPPDEFYRMIWDRTDDTYFPCKALGMETVCGHEYEDNTTVVNKKEGYIRLDEGCGHGDAFSVGLYCIEDNTVMHIGQDDEIFRANCTGKIKIIDEKGKESIIESTKIPTEVTR